MKNVFVLILSGLFLLSTAGIAVAQEESQILPTVSPVQAPAPTPPSDYQLPYPGILPDNPLYIFKAFRDRVISFLISNPLKKSEFDLLQADKRIAAAQELSENHKSDSLIASTVSKAENYFDESIGQAEEAHKEKLFTGDISRQLGQSSEKHLEVIIQLEKGAPSSLKKALINEEKRVQQFKKQAIQLQNAK